MPGTPSIEVRPEYWGTPSRKGNLAVATEPVLIMWMRTAASGPLAATIPFSTANGPTPASMLPQFWASLTTGSSTDGCRNR